MSRPDQVYVLMYKGTPISAHSRWEGASAKMADYAAEMQREMKVFTVRVDD